MLKPIGDHILVQPVAREETTASGIVIPDTAKEKPQQGVVIAVGSGKYVEGTLVSFKDMGIETGMTVMFTKYGPTEVKIGDIEYYILESHDILGVIDEPKSKKVSK
jgi:chaperonin GroES